MSFLKKASEKLKEVQSISKEKLGDVKAKLPSQHHHQHPFQASGHHQSSFQPEPIQAGGAAVNQGRFIVRNPETAQLEVEGTGEVVRFASLCAPELFDNDGFEKEDTMRTIAGFGRWPVTRTYTLKVKSCRIGKGHINGWDPEREDFLYDEDMFRSIDHTIALAAQYNVRLIIPIINQDFGSEDTNWVGNFSDLIRHRRGLNSWEECKNVNWWTEEDCLDSMKKITTYLLNRINTFTQVRIGDDPTILAFETGNEMNNGGLRPAPACWTLEIAAHIKRLAPKALVMDGSFARTDAMEFSHEREVLQSDLVDMISWHYYGFGEKWRIEHDVKMARKHGKVFICGEYGFFARGHEFQEFLKHCASHGVSGTLAWSLRPHSVKGGFKTHGEGNDIWSYHAPGWQPAHLRCGEHHEWDHRETDVIHAIQKAAFKLTGDKIPSPVLGPPELFMCGDQQSFSWRGAAWADCYELWTNITPDANGWEFFQGGLTDNVKEGKLKYYCQNILNAKRCMPVYVMMRGITRGKEAGPFSNVLCIGSE